MPNYRGGDNNISPQAADLIKQIRSGTAPYQQRRDQFRRSVIGGAQAALMGISGFGHAIYNENKSRNEAMDAATKAAKEKLVSDYQKAGHRADGTWGGDEYAPRTGEVDPYTAPTFTGAGAQDMAKDEPLHTQSFAKSVLSDIDAHEDAVQLPYGAEGQKVWNRRAFDEADEQAGLMARDIGLARTIIAAQRGQR